MCRSSPFNLIRPNPPHLSTFLTAASPRLVILSLRFLFHSCFFFVFFSHSVFVNLLYLSLSLTISLSPFVFFYSLSLYPSGPFCHSNSNSGIKRNPLNVQPNSWKKKKKRFCKRGSYDAVRLYKRSYAKKKNKQTNTQTNKQTNMSSSVSVFVFLYSGKLYRLQLKTFLLCLPQHYKMKVWKRRFFVGGLNDYFLFPHSSAIPLYLGVVTVTDFQVLVRQKMYIVLEHDDCNGDIFPFFFFFVQVEA